jgi:hypothetical protein
MKNTNDLEAESSFDFCGVWDGGQSGNESLSKRVLRAKEDRLRSVAFHNLACIDQCDSMA